MWNSTFGDDGDATTRDIEGGTTEFQTPLTMALKKQPTVNEVIVDVPNIAPQRRTKASPIFELSVIENRFDVTRVESASNERVYIVRDMDQLVVVTKPVNVFGFTCSSKADVADSMLLARALNWCARGPVQQHLATQRNLVSMVSIPHKPQGDQSTPKAWVDYTTCLMVCAILDYELRASHHAGELLNMLQNVAVAHAEHFPPSSTPASVHRLRSDQTRLEAALPNAPSEAATTSAFAMGGGNYVTRRAGNGNIHPSVVLTSQPSVSLADDAEAKNKSTKKTIKRTKERKELKRKLRMKRKKEMETKAFSGLPESKKRQALVSLWNQNGGIKSTMFMIGGSSVGFLNTKVQVRIDQRRILNGERPLLTSSSSSSSSSSSDNESANGESGESSDESTSSDDSKQDESTADDITKKRKIRGTNEEASSHSGDSSDSSLSTDDDEKDTKLKRRWRFKTGSFKWTKRLFENLTAHWTALFGLDQTSAKHLAQWLECECEGWHLVDALPCSVGH